MEKHQHIRHQQHQHIWQGTGGRAVGMTGSEQRFPLTQGPGQADPIWSELPIPLPGLSSLWLFPPPVQTSHLPTLTALKCEGGKGCMCQVIRLLGLEETVRLTNTYEDSRLYPTEAGFSTQGQRPLPCPLLGSTGCANPLKLRIKRMPRAGGATLSQPCFEP